MSFADIFRRLLGAEKLPDHDPGDFPANFVDPVTNPDVPFVVAYEDEDPVPPADRLAEEPVLVGAEDNGQDERVAEGMFETPRGRFSLVPSGVSGLSLKDYSKSPLGKGWGSPCSGQRATVLLREAKVSVDIRIAELVGLIMRANERDGYLYRAVDTGAYNCRKIAGTTTWSNHAWALAIDENWQTNPYTALLRTDKPEWLRHRWNRYGFAWGGDYSGRKDAMHFEFMGTPAQAQAALELARVELGKDQPKPPAPQPVPSADVRFVQERLTYWGFPVTVDGFSGPQTKAAIVAFQKAKGLTADGIVGPVTRAKLSENKPAPRPPAPVGRPVLRRGSKGEAVRQLQAHLKANYSLYAKRLIVDGDFGPGTERVVKEFQRRAGLTADGIVGPATYRKLGI